MSTPLTSEAPDAQGASLVRWNTTRGYVSYETASDSDRRHAGTLAGLRWGADYTWPGGATADERERNLETFLARFGVPAHVELWLKATTARTVQFHQEHDGTGVHFTQGYADGGSNFASETGFYTEVSVGPLFDLSGVDVAPSPESASQTAQDYLRCVLGRDGKTEANGYRQTTVQPPGFAVVNESLAWNFHIAFTEPGERSHCGFSRQVYVDVTTGAVHGWDWPYCD